MYKHRDNIQHNPTTIDPSGAGQVLSAQPAAPFAVAGDAATPAAPVAAGRKRPRDVRGIDRFRQVMFGERGFPRLHGMVSRTPALMYPPDGIDAARRRVQRREEEERRKAADALADVELQGLFEERRQAEALDDASAPSADDTLEQRAQDDSLARYHHKQLDSLLKLFYEFNHTTFVKLPVNDTLQLISRCGKEAVAHVMDYEMHSRLAREAMLKELRELRAEETELARRRAALDAADEGRALQEAERVDDDMEAYLMEMASAQMEAAAAEKDLLDRLELVEPPHDTTTTASTDETLVVVSTAGEVAAEDRLASSSASPPRRSVHFAEPASDGHDAGHDENDCRDGLSTHPTEMPREAKDDDPAGGERAAEAVEQV